MRAAGLVLAFLLAVMSLGGLLIPATYAREAPAWTIQAIAQDWFDVVVAVPALALSALWAARGSRRALLVYAGVLLFTAYTAVIYAFAVHLNALFLVYCAVLGISLYTSIVVCARVWQSRRALHVATTIPHRSAGGFLVALGGVFALLWLAQLVPAALSGTQPPELVAMDLPTNPVHVIDLSFILPLHVIAGVALWRMKSAIALLAPIVLVFGAFMSASIGLMTASAGNVPITVAMGVVSLVSTIFSVRVVRAVDERSAQPRPSWSLA